MALAPIIYEPKGRAAEYSPLAANLYKGCLHGCVYCFGPGALKETRERFHSDVFLKTDALMRLTRDAKKMQRSQDDRQVLFSFISDAYQPGEDARGITRAAIKIMIDHGLTFTVLTKGGTRAAADFDLLAGYPHCSFGTSLTFWDEDLRRKYEPGAATILDRIEAIRQAKEAGIKTWVSLEPVIFPDQAIEIIKNLHPYVDHWKIGKVNGFPLPEPVNWLKFRENVKDLLDSLGADYYLKRSLTELSK